MNFIINQNYISKNKISVLCNGSTNGINTDYFKRESIDEIFIKTLKNKYKINDKNFIYIFIGRIVGDKGVNEIINAFKIISKKNQIVKLLIVGEYENKLDPLEPRSITEIESNKNIIFCGWQDDVRPYLLISDVLLLPSYREGFPNVVLQAGAMEIPSIVTNINGCNEIIKNNFNGLIVEKKNHIDLKNKMLKILNDKKLYRYLKENCRKNITKNYEQKLIWDSLLIEYKKILY